MLLFPAFISEFVNLLVAKRKGAFVRITTCSQSHCFSLLILLRLDFFSVSSFAFCLRNLHLFGCQPCTHKHLSETNCLKIT